MLVAYLAFWDEYIALAGMTPPFDVAAVTPRLAEVTTGAETQQLLDFLRIQRDDRSRAARRSGPLPVVVSNDGTTSVVEDCMDDRLGVYRVAMTSGSIPMTQAVASTRRRCDRWAAGGGSRR